MNLDLNTLPSAISDALLLRARRQGRPLQEVALAALVRGLEAEEGGDALEVIELADPDSSWIESPAFEQALIEFAQLDAHAV